MNSLRTPSLAFRGAVVGLLLLLSFPRAQADDARDAAVEKDMARLKTAMLAKDQATPIDMMYAPIVELGGGREKLLAQASKLMKKVETTSFTANKPYTYYSGKLNDYVVVPTHVLMTISGTHFDSTSFELGITPHPGGKPWQYVDGAGISPAVRTRLFPDLPAEVVLPEHSMKKLD